MAAHGSLNSLNLKRGAKPGCSKTPLALNTGVSGDLSDSSQITPNIRVYLTVSVLLTFFSAGMANSLFGPTLLHLTHLFLTNIQTLSFALTIGNIAYLLGSLLCGFIYDHFNAELQFALATFITGLAAFACPWAPSVYIYYAIFATQYLAMGFVDAACQAYIMSLWIGHRLKEPVLQAMHCSWSIGATICPFLLIPFLSELPDTPNVAMHQSTESINNGSQYTYAANYTEGLYFDTEGRTVDTQIYDEVAKVRYCYVVIGAAIMFFSSFFFVAFFKNLGSFAANASTDHDSSMSTDIGRIKTYADNKPFYVTMLFWLGLFYFCYIWCESICGNYLATFVTEYLGWTNRRGALVTSVYWGCTGLGSVLAIPVSMCLKPGTMLMLNLSLTTVAFACMLLIPYAGGPVLWIAAPLAAFAMSSIFASMILWASEHVAITGRVGAVLLVGASLGGSSGGVIAGTLLQQSGYMWMVYLSLIAALCASGVFASLVAMVTWAAHRGSRELTMTMEVQLSAAADRESAETEERRSLVEST